MIWALLAILGVPIWLIVGALASMLWSRRRCKAQEGVFALAIRPSGEESWPRSGAYGRLFRDVLVVNRGLALARTEVYPIIDVEQIDLTDPPRKMDDPRGWRLAVEGRTIEVALSAADGGRLDELGLAPSS